MNFLEEYRIKKDFARLSRLWDRMRAYIEANHTKGTSGTDEEFLELKKEIGQALVVLQHDFGSAAMNNEAENAAMRIRSFLAQLPTVAKLDSTLTRDQEGLQKAWHGIFLILCELSGTIGRARRSGVGGGSAKARYAPVSGEPRAMRRRLHIARPIGSLFRIAFTVLALGVLLWIVLFLSQSAGLLGTVDPEGKWLPPQNAVLAHLGAIWQSAKSWAIMTVPGIYLPLAGIYAAHPQTSVIVMVGLAFLFVGYVLFIRAK